MVSVLLRVLIGIDFSLTARIKQLFYSFSLFPSTARWSKLRKENTVNPPAVHRKSQFSAAHSLAAYGVNMEKGQCETWLGLFPEFVSNSVTGDLASMSS
jgi:hypothetical protein